MTMTYEYQGRIARKYVAQGREEGREEGLVGGILTVLEARHLTVSALQRARIAECADIDQLTAWLRRAATAADADEIFG